MFFLCLYLFLTYTDIFTDEIIQCLRFASKQSKVCVLGGVGGLVVDKSRLAMG